MLAFFFAFFFFLAWQGPKCPLTSPSRAITLQLSRPLARRQQGWDRLPVDSSGSPNGENLPLRTARVERPHPFDNVHIVIGVLEAFGACVEAPGAR